MLKSNFFRVLTLACFIISIYGCSGLPIEQAASKLRETKVCCTNFTQLNFQPLGRNERTKFTLSNSSPAMDLPEGKSFVAAFALPANTKSVAVQSVYEAYLPETSYVDPVIVLLNQSKEEIERYTELEFQIDKHVIFSGLFEWLYAGSVPVKPDTAFLVIYANNQSKRVFSVASDNGTHWPAPPAPIGTLALIAR